MSDINYITDRNGTKTHILLPLTHKKRISMEYIEDLQDIIAYELLKDEESVEYNAGIEKIIRAKMKQNV